jgi:hypothetical protein
MRVKTPAMKLDVQLESARRHGGELQFTGLAGLLPCDVSLTPSELRRVLGMVLKPSILGLLLKR